MSESQSNPKIMIPKVVKETKLRKKLQNTSTKIPYEDNLRALYFELHKIFGEENPRPNFDLDNDDLAIVHDIRAYSKEGQVFKVKGQTVMDGILMNDSLPEAPFRFHSFQITNIYQPLRTRANRYIQNRVSQEQNKRLLTDAHAPYVDSEIPYSNDQFKHDMSAHGAAPPDGIRAFGET
jgi:hypothetical protein